jgi:hypothetical protein
MLAAVAAASGYFAMLDDRLSDTQIHIATAALKRGHRDLFASDPVYGDPVLWRFSSPAFAGLLELFLVPTDFADPSLPFRALAGPVVMLYLCGMYALLLRQTRSWSIAAFVAVMSSTITYTLGRWYWGAGSLASITPSTVYMAAVPLIVLAFLQYEHRRRLILVFGAIGLLGNLHLVTAMNLTIVLLIVYLGRRRFALRAWPMAIGCALAALATAWPFTWYTIAVRSRITPVEAETDPATIYEAFRLAKLALLYPDLLQSLLNWLLLVGVLIIPAIMVVLRMERFRVRNRGVWLWLIAGGLFVSMGLHGLSQLAGLIQAGPPPVIGFVQASSLVMLALYVLFAQGLTQLFRIVREHRGLLRWACAVLVGVWMIPSDNLRVARHAAYDAATTFMEESEKPLRVQQLHLRRDRGREVRRIAEWAAAQSDRNAVFLTDDIEFRMYARRSILASRDDVRITYLLAPSRLARWMDRVAQQRHVLALAASQPTASALRQWIARLREEPRFADVPQWYVIFRADAAPEANGALNEVVRRGWGNHYRLFRLNLTATRPETSPTIRREG